MILPKDYSDRNNITPESKTHLSTTIQQNKDYGLIMRTIKAYATEYYNAQVEAVFDSLTPNQRQAFKTATHHDFIKKASTDLSGFLSTSKLLDTKDEILAELQTFKQDIVKKLIVLEQFRLPTPPDDASLPPAASQQSAILPPPPPSPPSIT